MIRVGIILLALAMLPSTPRAQSEQTFCNPIVEGFYPDPSICRVGDEYYLVNSTFSYFPGVNILRSRDLVHWALIGYVLDRPEQLNLDKQGVSRGLFAPAIRYHAGTFYVTCTLVDKGGNFVVTAEKPEGPWSNPVWLPEVNGIDPSLFFDHDGKAYLLYNSVAPDDKPAYEGHRTIRMREFDPAGLRLVGKEVLLINGGTDIRKKPIWIEAPHLFKKDGIYYLIAAEGGTAEQHSEVVFRSVSVRGPYEPFSKNPILTQRDLDPGRKHPITCTGHADFVQTVAGDWWAVFLGSRPYADDYVNTGRETFLAAVQWSDGWPVINPGFREVRYHAPLPVLPPVPTNRPYGGNFTLRDTWDSPELDPSWVFLRTPQERWYDLQTRRGFLTLKLRPETCAGDGNPSFLAQRQQHLTSTAAVALDFSAKAENEKAGLLVFHNESHYYFLCASEAAGQRVVQLYRAGESEPIAAKPIDDSHSGDLILFRIESHGRTYAFSYGFDRKAWIVLKEGVDGTFLSTKKAGGFVGCMYAVYVTSSGRPSTNTAAYDWYEYSGNDEVYR
jgi:xylan 1,4-beta-xylosidase